MDKKKKEYSFNPNKEIFFYTDYRAFLKGYYEALKKSMPGFSYKYMAERAGFSSRSFQKLVIDGKKNLTKESVYKIAKALRLNKKATEYFENIVFFTQVKELDRKAYYLELIDKYRKRNKPEMLLPAEYAYLEEWYFPVLREIVELPEFGEDPDKISKMLLFALKPDIIKKSLDFMLSEGFLQRDDNGRLIKKEKTLHTGRIEHDETLAVKVRQFHLKMIELAAKAVADFPNNLRHVTNTTLSMSRESYEKALQRIETMRYELLELAASDDKADQIYQLNMNLFPMIKKESNEE
jgi:uncharacterized protein (TIGR02147 family)